MYPYKDNCNYYRKIIKHSSEESFQHMLNIIKGIKLVNNYKIIKYPNNISYMCEDLSYIISSLIDLENQSDLKEILNVLINDPLIPNKALEVIFIESYLTSTSNLEDEFIQALNIIQGKGNYSWLR